MTTRRFRRRAAKRLGRKTQKTIFSPPDFELGRYAYIRLDRWFKRSFGTPGQERLLQLVLNEIIPDRHVRELSYVQQEHVNPFPDKADARIDVECVDEDGTRFIVEMQLGRQDFFYERALFYSSFGIIQQRKAGERPFNYPPVYFIGLMDFSFHRDEDRVLYRYQLQETHSGELMTDRITFLFIELPVGAKRASSPKATPLDTFCYVLSNIENLREPPADADGELYHLLFNSAEIVNFADEEQNTLRSDMMTEYDRQAILDFAVKEAREEGEMQGRLQGLKEVARNLLTSGMVPDDVARLTGLSPEIIASLSAR